MFDFVRNHSRLTLGFLLLLIIPSFVVFGIEGYTRFTGPGTETVAQVDGVKITRQEWDDAHRRAVERLRRQPGFDEAMVESAEARRATLDALVRERTLMAASDRLRLAPSDARLQRLFTTDPNYASIRNPDGSVNQEFLRMQGLSSALLEQQLRAEYGMRQVLAGVEASAIGSPLLMNQTLDALLQRREIQVQRFDPVAYAAKVSPSDAELEAWHKANEAALRTPEQAKIEYVMLDQATLAKAVTVSEADARKFYDENAARFTAPEERRARHILIEAGADKPAAERQAAKARAEALLAELKQNPSAFAELAKKNSADTGSATQGGELPPFGRGAMVKPFEDAAFALKPGETSGVVETEFGYHIIRLEAVTGGQKKPFEAVRAEIETELRNAAVARRWPSDAEQFNDLAYQQSESLQPLVDKYKLDKQTATVPRKAVAGTPGPLGSQKLLDALFAADALKNKRNTDAIETGPNQLVVARVVEHQPARVPPLAEVKEAVRQRVVIEQAAAAAKKDGLARLAAVKGKPDESLGPPVIVSRAQTQGAPATVLEEVMRLDASALPAFTGVDVGNAGYMVIKVVRALPREPVPGGDDVLRGQYARAVGAAETQAYLAALKKRYRAEVKPAAAAASAPAAS